MPLTSIWGNLNADVQDAPNDPNDDLNNGFQASCGAAANPEPLDFYLWEVGTCIAQLEIDIAAAGGGGGAGTITTATNLGAADLFSGINGTALEFRGIDNADGNLSITQSATDLTIDIDEGALFNSANFNAAVDARIDQELNSALFADGEFAQWNAANGRFEPAAAVYDPSDTTQVGGVYTQSFNTTGTTTSTTFTLPAGGTWAYTVSVMADSQTDNYNITPGGTYTGGSAGNQIIATRAGTAAGGQSFNFNLPSFGGDVSLFAIRIA